MTTLEQRKEIVEQAKHSNVLEGLLTSRTYDIDADSYVAGDISASELVERTRARFGLI